MPAEPIPPRHMRGRTLTPREQEILLLIVQGDANPAIAAKLGISCETVKHHITAIFDKTGLSSRRDLIAKNFDRAVQLHVRRESAALRKRVEELESALRVLTALQPSPLPHGSAARKG